MTLAALDDFAYRVPIKVTFDPFRDLPMVPVRRRDVDSNESWGKVICNRPVVGAEHRARLHPDRSEGLGGRAIKSLRPGWFEVPPRIDAHVPGWHALAALQPFYTESQA